ncbi:MAG: substrate-binding domain-containing protein [Hymenobacter sp.]
MHFDRVFNQENVSRVVIDDWSGAFAVTEHLILEGCRRVAILAGPASLLISRQRQAGYQSALRKHGLPMADELVAHINFRPEAAVACLDAWLALPHPPDAIFAISYSNAFDLLLALRRRGLRVPEDLAIVGFGDEFLASLIEPGLTTVDLHPYRIGQQAARLFLEHVQLQGRFEPRTCVVKSELIIRQSSLRGQGQGFQLAL